MKHHPQQPDDKLRFLSDIIVLKEPVRIGRSASATSSSRSACATSPTTRAASPSDAGAAPRRARRRRRRAAGAPVVSGSAAGDRPDASRGSTGSTQPALASDAVARAVRSGTGADPVAQHALQRDARPARRRRTTAPTAATRPRRSPGTLSRTVRSSYSLARRSACTARRRFGSSTSPATISPAADERPDLAQHRAGHRGHVGRIGTVLVDAQDARCGFRCVSAR